MTWYVEKSSIHPLVGPYRLRNTIYRIFHLRILSSNILPLNLTWRTWQYVDEGRKVQAVSWPAGRPALPLARSPADTAQSPRCDEPLRTVTLGCGNLWKSQSEAYVNTENWLIVVTKEAGLGKMEERVRKAIKSGQCWSRTGVKEDSGGDLFSELNK